MKTRFGSLIIIVLILTLLLTIGDIVLTYQNLVSAHDNSTLVYKTYQVNSEFDKAMISILNAETGQRGYLFTNNPVYLDLYKASIAETDQHINRLQTLTKDNPSIQNRIQSLKQKITERFDLLKEGITIRNQQTFEAFQAFISEGAGKRKMDEIRKSMNELQATENLLLHNQQLQNEKSYLTLFISSAFTSILSIIFIVITYYSINREIAKRTELEKNKDEFFSMASHELKTPITSLNIFIHVLKKKINANDKLQAKRYLNKISVQTDKLRALISDFLDLSRVQTGKMKYNEEKFKLEPLIKETIDEIKGTTKKHVILLKGNCKVLIEADRYRIYQVLVNLITNAVKYSPKGGKIIIRTENVDKQVYVHVQDQGIGIDKKYQDKIFDRLYQVNDPVLQAYPGFGIGLFVSKEIIRHHKGKIWVKSEKGNGSTFSFSLPIHYH